jgi:serine/threonine-protein kinase Chk1
MGLSYNPWNRVSQSAFGNVKEFKIIDLLVGILNINADQRFTINDIRRSDWFQMPQPMLTNGRLNNPAAVAERMKSKINLSGESIVEDAP